MKRRPSFQFYPYDWRKDLALRSCSLEARGLWVDLMCIAHDCEPYGYLTVNGVAMDEFDIAREIGISTRKSRKLVNELSSKGVIRRDENGVIYSKRMVEDEGRRLYCANAGQDGAAYGHLGASHGWKGGRPRNEITPPKPPQKTPPEDEKPPPAKPPLSSSSSSSIPSNKRSEQRASSTHGPNVSAHSQIPKLDRIDAVKAMRAAGIADTNPRHPDLIALCEDGMDVREAHFAGTEAVRRKAGFAYALRVARRRLDERRNAEPIDIAPGLRVLPGGKATPPPATEPQWRTEQRERMRKAAPYAVEPRPGEERIRGDLSDFFPDPLPTPYPTPNGAS